MFYSVIDFFSYDTIQKITRDINCYSSRDYSGWSERYNYTVRTDRCCLYYSDWVWRLLRKKISSTHLLPVDWIFRPWRIHKFSAGGFYSWHTDNVITNKEINSVRTRTIVINLDTEYDFKLKTVKGDYDLKPGTGIQMPVEDYYEINIGRNERLEHRVLTTWGMRSKLFS